MSALPTPREDGDRIGESAARSGVQINEAEAIQRLTTMVGIKASLDGLQQMQ